MVDTCMYIITIFYMLIGDIIMMEKNIYIYHIIYNKNIKFIILCSKSRGDLH